jgi:hypothetical protein
MRKKPNQADIAAALQVSPGRVSQLVRDGMPTYSLEAAVAWKTQHVAPIMRRAESLSSNARGQASLAAANAIRRPDADPTPSEWVAGVEALGGHVLDSIQAGKRRAAAGLLTALRQLLRAMPDGLSPRLPALVWVELLDYLLARDAKLRTLVDHADLLTSADVAANIGDGGHRMWSADLVLADACDWGDLSLDMDNATEGGQ